MPPRFDGQWLRDNFPGVAESMDRFIDKIKQETHGEILGELGIVRIPLNLYRARNATSRQWHKSGPFHHPFASTPVFLLGDSAIGSPYFQSISLGFECAMFLARLIAIRDLPLQEMLDRYELYVYKQWLRVYMRSKVIKHNKEAMSPEKEVLLRHEMALGSDADNVRAPDGGIGSEAASSRVAGRSRVPPS